MEAVVLAALVVLEEGKAQVLVVMVVLEMVQGTDCPF